MRYKGKTVIYDLMTGLGLLGITLSNKNKQLWTQDIGTNIHRLK